MKPFCFSSLTLLLKIPDGCGEWGLPYVLGGKPPAVVRVLDGWLLLSLCDKVKAIVNRENVKRTPWL
jgi:hypothetical protein